MLVACKACGKEIGKGVKTCVNCGADQRGFIGRHKVLTGIVAFFVFCIFVAALGGEDTPTPPKSSPSSPTSSAAVSSPSTTASSPSTTSTVSTTKVEANNPGITKDEFDQLKSGMTYEQATKIIGGPGEVMSESGNKGEALHTVMYTYKAEKGSIGANANLMFQGNKLQNKAQYGLE